MTVTLETNKNLPTEYHYGSNPADNPTNPVVPDLDDIAKMDRARVELPRRIKDRYKWLEEKFRAIESVDYHFRVDAK
ncbi:receptor-like protein 12 [Gossypium australe]|uniref:Receptor-like protein 12 n=1 Tax=Gossypium australe TaxID=47621 RepID=A0A5B6WIC5_9ROSI|nr:receptor-like protein 12 [Gossypium australe]